MLKIFISDHVRIDVTTVLAPNVRTTAGQEELNRNCHYHDCQLYNVT